MRVFKELFIIFAAVIFQSQLRWSHQFDFLVLISFYIVLRFSWLEGAFWAFLGGLLWDSLSGTSLGLKSFSTVGACGLVGLIHSVIYQEHLSTKFVMVFAGTVFSLILDWFFYMVGGVTPVSFAGIFWTGLWTSVLAVFIYPILDQTFGKRYGHWLVS
jgi:rod shape-determining protein MreD